MSPEADEWYGVRCVFQWTQRETRPYEERITLWRAESLDAAIELAEDDAREYAENLGATYLGLAQAYAIKETELEPGAEAFSLLRDSPLPAEQYLDRYFDSGEEHQRRISDPA
jgi:hypothetical protein